MLNRKIWVNFQRIIELFTSKLSLSSQKYGFGIRDPGSRGQKGTGSRIRIRPIELSGRIFCQLAILWGSGRMPTGADAKAGPPPAGVQPRPGPGGRPRQGIRHDGQHSFCFLSFFQHFVSAK
jgi:hypothetical protein